MRMLCSSGVLSSYEVECQQSTEASQHCHGQQARARPSRWGCYSHWLQVWGRAPETYSARVVLYSSAPCSCVFGAPGIMYNLEKFAYVTQAHLSCSSWQTVRPEGCLCFLTSPRMQLRCREKGLLCKDSMLGAVRQSQEKQPRKKALCYRKHVLPRSNQQGARHSYFLLADYSREEDKGVEDLKA